MKTHRRLPQRAVRRIRRIFRRGRDPRLTPHSLGLGHGIELRAVVPSLDGSIEISVLRRGRTLIEKVFTPDAPSHGFSLSLPFLDVDAGLEIDAFGGELRGSGQIRFRGPLRRRWRTLLDVDDEVLMRICPAVGQIDGSPAVIEPSIDDPSFGGSQLCTPTVLRIFVDEDARAVADVGQIVKRTMFPDYPPFVFNTVACVGRVAAQGGLGLYTDPNSIWFNVFFGHYQLDCPKPAWSRPFGYQSAAGIESEVEPEDIARLGKSDWNWFSNWMYGVPTEDVMPYSRVDMSSIEVEALSPRRIGSTLWHGLSLSQVDVASCYESDAKGAARLVRNTIIDDVWRRSFGLPNPQPGHAVSFVPTTIKAEVRMAYWEDEGAFHTLIFGGTAATESDPGFLATQMEAVESVIERGYPFRGF